MSAYHVIAIPETLAQDVREPLKAPRYGHPAHVELAAGYGPCRLCLQKFREGEEDRILFTYDPSPAWIGIRPPARSSSTRMPAPTTTPRASPRSSAT